MGDLKFCPKCRRPAFRVEEGEEGQINILSAPNWKVAMSISKESKNITMGCPWCSKGKVMVL